VTGHVPKAMSKGILGLLPKEASNEFHSITLLDTVYKLISAVVNARATRAISVHDGIHGFCKRRGCNTAIKDTKWDMMACQEVGKTYHQVFLDLSKAFDTVDWERLILVMKACFGTRTIRFFTNCWADSYVAPARGVRLDPELE
jgi:Reverse transcriptase (RNA-dependent DNA polymerase)